VQIDWKTLYNTSNNASIRHAEALGEVAIASLDEGLVVRRVTAVDRGSGVRAIHICTKVNDDSAVGREVPVFRMVFQGQELVMGADGCSELPGPHNEYQLDSITWEWREIHIQAQTVLSEPLGVHVHVKVEDGAGAIMEAHSATAFLVGDRTEAVYLPEARSAFCADEHAAGIIMVPLGLHAMASKSANHSSGAELLQWIKALPGSSTTEETAAHIRMWRWRALGCTSGLATTGTPHLSVDPDGHTLVVFAMPGLRPHDALQLGSAALDGLIDGVSLDLSQWNEETNEWQLMLTDHSVEVLGNQWYTSRLPSMLLHHGNSYNLQVSVHTWPTGVTKVMDSTFTASSSSAHSAAVARVQLATCTNMSTSSTSMTHHELESAGLSLDICFPTVLMEDLGQAMRIMAPFLGAEEVLASGQLAALSTGAEGGTTRCGITPSPSTHCINRQYFPTKGRQSRGSGAHMLSVSSISAAGDMASISTLVRVSSSAPLPAAISIYQYVGEEAASWDRGSHGSLQNLAGKMGREIVLNFVPELTLRLHPASLEQPGDPICVLKASLHSLQELRSDQLELLELSCPACSCNETSPPVASAGTSAGNVTLLPLFEGTGEIWQVQVSNITAWTQNEAMKLHVEAIGPNRVTSLLEIDELVAWTPETPSVSYFHDGLGTFSTSTAPEVAALVQPTRFSRSEQAKVVVLASSAPSTVNKDVDLNCAPRRGSSLLPNMPIVALTSYQAIVHGEPVLRDEAPASRADKPANRSPEYAERAAEMCVNLQRLVDFSLSVAKKGEAESGETVEATLDLRVGDPLMFALDSVRCSVLGHIMDAWRLKPREPSSVSGPAADIMNHLIPSHAPGLAASERDLVAHLTVQMPVSPTAWSTLVGVSINTSNATVYSASWGSIMADSAGVGAVWWRLLDSVTDTELVTWTRLTQEQSAANGLQAVIWPALDHNSVLHSELALVSAAACGPQAMTGGTSCSARSGTEHGASAPVGRFSTDGVRLTCTSPEDCASFDGADMAEDLFICL
jgi:hypothetical protein